MFSTGVALQGHARLAGAPNTLHGPEVCHDTHRQIKPGALQTAESISNGWGTGHLGHPEVYSGTDRQTEPGS